MVRTTNHEHAWLACAPSGGRMSMLHIAVARGSSRVNLRYCARTDYILRGHPQ